MLYDEAVRTIIRIRRGGICTLANYFYYLNPGMSIKELDGLIENFVSIQWKKVLQGKC
jgi:hypothetical protein